MFETGQRSAISTSELGLYSDRGDRYNRNRYGPLIRKFVIGVMAVVAVVLTAIFIYDFTSVASASSKVSQETKHIYILQNALKKPSSIAKRQYTSTIVPHDFEPNRTRSLRIQDRSDNANIQELSYVDKSTDDVSETIYSDSWNAKSTNVHRETKSQNVDDVRSRIEPAEADQAVEGKQLFNNHAVVYRVRQRFKYPDPSEEFNEEESRPAPFHFELKTPQPASFNARPKFPQLTQYRYPHTSRNIQDIIKYLTNDPQITKRGIKFTGVYVNPKKYDLHPDAGEMMANSDRNEYQMDMANGDQDQDDDEDDEDDDNYEGSRYAVGNNVDPFYPFKPKHPADVNLLAPSNVRFSPSGTHRYNPHHNLYFQRPIASYQRPVVGKPIADTSSYNDNVAAYSTGSYGKKRKPKPFSVMLDIYPITDLNESPNNKKASRPRPPASPEDYDPRRPMAYTRGQRYHPASQTQPIPIVAVPSGQSGMSEEEERQQMIFHLNLYPRKKNKLNRNDIIDRSASMRPEDHQNFMHSVMTPLEAITKQLTDHSTIEESKYEETDLPTETKNFSLTRYEPSSSENQEPLEKFNDPENDGDEMAMDSNNNDTENHTDNTKIIVPDDDSDIKYSNITEKNISEQTKKCENCLDSKNSKIKFSTKDIDTPEGFQAFADGLLAAE